MADVLSTVLVTLALFTTIGWWVEWLGRQWVAVAMVGAVLPDLDRFEMFLSAETIEAATGIPFSWSALSTFGGLFVLAAIGALLFRTPRHQKRAFLLQVGGGTVHIAMDMVVKYADGYDGRPFYPVTEARTPTPGLYVSSDRWVLAVALAVAGVALAVDYWRRRGTRS